MRAPALPVCILLVVICACSDTSTMEPEPVPGGDGVTAVRVTPDARVLEPGATVQLVATAYDASGNIVEDAAIEWTSMDSGIATVTGDGEVVAHDFGSTEIVAQTGEVEQAVAIGVLDDADESDVCAGGSFIAIITEKTLEPLIRARLSRFEADLCAEGHGVRELRSSLRSAGEIRSWLQREESRTAGALEGALLIGDIPHAYQWVTLHSANPSIPDASEEAISFQFYADLDGSFAASPGYTSRSGRAFSYDAHTGEVGWEIWVGVLPPAPGGQAATVDAVNGYLDRNHAWRTGGAKPPRGFLEVSEFHSASDPAESAALLASLQSGVYAWTPFSDSPTAHIFFDSPSVGMSVSQGYDALETGVADFTVLDAHGWYGGSGQLTIDWAKTRPIRASFFWSNGCAVGDLDHTDNFLTAVLYSPGSEVVVAKGTTNDSGGMGNNENGFFGHNIATAMAGGESIGQAILAHVNVPLIEPWRTSREFQLATSVLLGDPSLRLRE